MPGNARIFGHLHIMTAIFQPDAGPGGLGVVAVNAPASSIGSACEQGEASSDYLHLRAVFRALELARHLNATRVSVLCPDERISWIINHAITFRHDSPIVLLYMKTKTLMNTFEFAEVVAVPGKKVMAARKLAITASRVDEKKLNRRHAVPPRDRQHY